MAEVLVEFDAAFLVPAERITHPVRARDLAMTGCGKGGWNSVISKPAS